MRQIDGLGLPVEREEPAVVYPYNISHFMTSRKMILLYTDINRIHIESQLIDLSQAI